MSDHIAKNRASRERLAAVTAKLGGRTVVLPDGWTAAALLGHLAFWDRLSTARLAKHVKDGTPFESPSDVLTDLINEAGLAQWNATPLSAAIADANDASAEMDRLIESLPRDAVTRIQALGRPRLLDRSLHRSEHLDDLERALG